MFQSGTGFYFHWIFTRKFLVMEYLPITDWYFDFFLLTFELKKGYIYL